MTVAVRKVSLNIWKGNTPIRQELNPSSSAVLKVTTLPQKADHTICQELPVYVDINPKQAVSPTNYP